MQRTSAYAAVSGGLSETISDGKFMTKAFCDTPRRLRVFAGLVSPLLCSMVFLGSIASTPLFAGPSQGTQLELHFYGATSQHDLGLLRDGERKRVRQSGHWLELTRKAEVLELTLDGQVLAPPAAQGGIKVQQADMHCQVHIGSPGNGASGNLPAASMDPTIVLKRSGSAPASAANKSPVSKKPEETLVMEDGSDSGGGCEDDPKPKCDDDIDSGSPKAGTTKQVIIEKKVITTPGPSEGPAVMIRCVRVDSLR